MIHMTLCSDKINYIIGWFKTIDNMRQITPLKPFEQIVIDFFSDLSKRLLKTGKEFSDVATFAFWCRKASLQSMKERCGDLSGRLGNGMVFHSTPSNVPVNFAFSFAAGLLAGNANVVRLPAKDFPQVGIICDAVRSLLDGRYKTLAPYICFIKYAHIKEITDCLSQMCDSRVVWGGDATIVEMRKSPLQPRTSEINFADRHSICLIDSDEYVKFSDEKKDQVTLGFYNDTYLSDQNACTSPRLVVWLGSQTADAQEQFWNRLERLVGDKYELQPVQAIGKLHAFCKFAALEGDGYLEKNLDNRLWRMKLSTLTDHIMDFKYNSGFFFEYEASDIREIFAVCDKKCQTLSYIGCDKEYLYNMILSMRPRGVDRIVPVGKTMDFSLIWDGYDLIRSLSRKIEII